MKCKLCPQEFKAYNTIERLCPTCRGKKLKEKKDEIPRTILHSPDRRRVQRGLSKLDSSKKNGIANKSKAQTSKDSVIASLKNQYVQAHGMVCQSCEDEGQIDVSHIMKKSVRPELYTDPDNLMMQCRACHNSYEDLQDIERVKRFLNLAEILDYLERTDTKRYNRITEKLKATNKNDKGRI